MYHLLDTFKTFRSLESNSYNKANELQEEICAKKLEWRMAQLHLAAVKAQVDHDDNNTHSPRKRLRKVEIKLFDI